MSRLYVFREPGMIRCPGRFELCWTSWGLALELIWTGRDSEDDWPWMLYVHAFLPKLFLHLPIPWRPRWNHDPNGFGWSSFGFSWALDDPSLHLHWGETKVVWLPWMWEQVRHEVRRADGTWVPYVGSWERDKIADDREKLSYSYRYVLKSGEIQDRTATVYVERRARRMRWLKWTRLFERESLSINVDFDAEVGEETGSWKGGCVGCGWTMFQSETPEQALRRMEATRSF